MKKLTFQNQILLGVVGLGIGHVLTFLTGYGVFVNIGFIFYGFLFLLHPVLPGLADHDPRLRLGLRIVGAAIILLGCTMKDGGGDEVWIRRISDATGVDMNGAVLLESMDDHSGFHGDGTSFAVLDFSNHPMEDCPRQEGWRDLPLTENVRILIYGVNTSEGSAGPYLDVSMPEVQEGFWYFHDRQGHTFQDDGVLNRSSFNYTIAVYDAGIERMYYCEYDT